MIDKPRRDINAIASELQSTLKREAATVIDIGNLLLEAHEQLEHSGKWLLWLEANFGSSQRTAYNYMNAARFAVRFATVANLKLKPPVLYLLGGGTIPTDEIEAILKVAETEWVDLERANQIIDSIHKKRLSETTEERAERPHDTAEERAKELQELNDRAAAAAAERSEIDDILDGPSPVLPSPAEPKPVTVELKAFDEAVSTLLRLYTKPMHSFLGTTHDQKALSAVAEFMVGLVKMPAIDKVSDDYFKRFGGLFCILNDETVSDMAKSLETGEDLFVAEKQRQRERLEQQRAEHAAFLAQPITPQMAKKYTNLLKRRKLYEGACDLSWARYFEYIAAHPEIVLTPEDREYAAQWTSCAIG
jgi:Protein of unknown function (DUF3102)